MVETDELIRERLNRRDRVVQLKERNDGELLKSKYQVEKSKSPVRQRHYESR